MWPASFRAFLRLWKISAPMRRLSENVSAPTGMTMNSWTSIALSACAPPLMTFIMGRGSTQAPNAAHVTPERQAHVVRGRLGAGEADAKNRVRPKPALVVAAVKLAKEAVDRDLVEGVAAAQCVGDLAVHGCDGLQDALTPEPVFVAVAQLDSLPCPGRCTRGHRSPSVRAAFEEDLDLDGRVAPAVDDFPSAHVVDSGYRSLLPGRVPIRDFLS